MNTPDFQKPRWSMRWKPHWTRTTPKRCARASRGWTPEPRSTSPDPERWQEKGQAWRWPLWSTCRRSWGPWPRAPPRGAPSSPGATWRGRWAGCRWACKSWTSNLWWRSRRCRTSWKCCWWCRTGSTDRSYKVNKSWTKSRSAISFCTSGSPSDPETLHWAPKKPAPGFPSAFRCWRDSSRPPLRPSFSALPWCPIQCRIQHAD